MGVETYNTKTVTVTYCGDIQDGFTVDRRRSVSCPYAYTWNGSVCVQSAPDRDSCAATLANPIQIGTGNKRQIETDKPADELGLPFVRTYNSQAQYNESVGYGWSHTYSSRLLRANATSISTVFVRRPSGRSEYFNYESGVWSNNAGRASRLEETVDGWRYTNSEGAVEIYDTDGLLQSITTTSGSVQLLSYDESNRLVRVESEHGDWITLTYDDANRLSTLKDHAERVWSYSYDEVGNLVAAQLPDGRNRAYHYNEPTHTSGIDLPHALTGITDERGVRYASFEYASDGRAIASYHALNANKITVSYHARRRAGPFKIAGAALPASTLWNSRGWRS